VLYWCFTGALLVLYCCFKEAQAALLLLYYCFTAVLHDHSVGRRESTRPPASSLIAEHVAEKAKLNAAHVAEKARLPHCGACGGSRQA
jgi:hypothetical protein